jgi:hypothetical protein
VWSSPPETFVTGIETGSAMDIIGTRKIKRKATADKPFREFIVFLLKKSSYMEIFNGV